ncbi:hypothetical protein GCM10022384_53890 [Streptomyces marokkonensis]|uniref:Uncharacterized protein n=1 Tax=Streptomyces marokkonensis TaxID=324855 RepID=A0ABP7RNM0_9ACTN
MPNVDIAAILAGLNPSNVRIDSRGRIVVLDRDLARDLATFRGGDGSEEDGKKNGNCGCALPE